MGIPAGFIMEPLLLLTCPCFSVKAVRGRIIQNQIMKKTTGTLFRSRNKVSWEVLLRFSMCHGILLRKFLFWNLKKLIIWKHACMSLSTYDILLKKLILQISTCQKFRKVTTIRCTTKHFSKVARLIARLELHFSGDYMKSILREAYTWPNNLCYRGVDTITAQHNFIDYFSSLIDFAFDTKLSRVLNFLSTFCPVFIILLDILVLAARYSKIVIVSCKLNLILSVILLGKMAISYNLTATTDLTLKVISPDKLNF